MKKQEFRQKMLELFNFMIVLVQMSSVPMKLSDYVIREKQENSSIREITLMEEELLSTLLVDWLVKVTH